MAKKELSIDNDPYPWEEDTINGGQLRDLGSIPDDVQLFHIIPGSPDVLVELDTIIDLTLQRGLDRFSTDTVGSGAGS